jgi:hypothetical protein
MNLIKYLTSSTERKKISYEFLNLISFFLNLENIRKDPSKASFSNLEIFIPFIDEYDSSINSSFSESIKKFYFDEIVPELSF